MKKFKKTLEYIIEMRGYTQASISNIWGNNRQLMNKWITEERKVPVDYIPKLEKLLKIPREYWLDDNRKCLPYTDEQKDKIFQYELKRKWTYDGEIFSDIKKELEEKQQNKEELDDLGLIVERIDKARNIKQMYDEELKKEEQYYYFDNLQNRYSTEVCSYLKKNSDNFQSIEDYYNAVFIRERLLSRIYNVMQNTDDNVMEIIVSALEMYQKKHELIHGLTLSREVSERICDLLIYEEEKLIKQNQEEVKELEELFGEKYTE